MPAEAIPMPPMPPAATPTHVDACGRSATRIRRCGPGIRQGMLDIAHYPATRPVQFSDSDGLEGGTPGGSGTRLVAPQPLARPAVQLGWPAGAGAAVWLGPLPPARRHGRILAGLPPHSTTWKTLSLSITPPVMSTQSAVLINEYMTHPGMDARRPNTPVPHRPPEPCGAPERPSGPLHPSCPCVGPVGSDRSRSSAAIDAGQHSPKRVALHTPRIPCAMFHSGRTTSSLACRAPAPAGTARQLHAPAQLRRPACGWATRRRRAPPPVAGPLRKGA